MKKALHTLEEVTQLIRNHRKLILGGDERLLDQLPKEGTWIAGTTPYFIDENGGIFSQELIYVNDVTDVGVDFRTVQYTASSIQDITEDEFENGFTFLILPFLQPVHFQFGQYSSEYKDIYKNPLFGWVSGFKFEDFGTVTAKTYISGQKSETDGAAIHVALPANQVARLEIINMYELGDGDDVYFPKPDLSKGFGTRCIVKGKEMDLYEYITTNNIQVTLPFVTDFNGAKLAVSFILNHEAKVAHLVAPVYEDTLYKIAKKVDFDYQISFVNALQKDSDRDILLSLNCLFNFFNFGLEGKKVSNGTGLITYGEIGYHLVNDTFVYVVIDEYQ